MKGSITIVPSVATSYLILFHDIANIIEPHEILLYCMIIEMKTHFFLCVVINKVLLFGRGVKDPICCGFLP